MRNQTKCSLLLLALLALQPCIAISKPVRNSGRFVSTRGTHFIVNGRPFYTNGFNAYWMMYVAGDPSTRYQVTDAFQQASSYGMNLVRTWAFSDGGYRALHTSPGKYNEDMFKVYISSSFICMKRCMPKY